MRLSSPCARASSSRRRGITSSPSFLRRFSLPHSSKNDPSSLRKLLPTILCEMLLILRYFHHVYDIIRLANLINFLNLCFIIYNEKTFVNFRKLVWLIYLFLPLKLFHAHIISSQYQDINRIVGRRDFSVIKIYCAIKNRVSVKIRNLL